MLRRLLGGPGAARKAVLALLPVVLGAGLLLAAGDRPSTRDSVLETTQASVLPLGLDSSAPAATAQAPATPGATDGTVSTLAGGLPSESGGETTAVPGSASGPGPGAESTSAPESASTSWTGLPSSPNGVDGDADPGAAVSTAPAAESSAVSGPAAMSTQTTPTTPTPTTPTTRAAEVTTTTTTPPPPAPSGRARASGVEAEVVPLTNADRTAQGLVALSRSACLDSIASGYAEQMAGSRVMAHNPGAGPAVQGCRPNATWGDNVGTAAPCDTARLEREWMASPSHRRNILTGEFRLIGVGAWTDEQGGCWVQVLFSS